MVSSTALIYLSFLVKACMMMHNYSSKGRLGDKTINTRTHHQNFPQHWFFFSPFSSSCPARLMTCMPAVSERGRPATVVQTRLSCGTSLPLHWPQCSLSCFGFPNSFLLQQVQGRSMKFWSQIMWKSQLIAFPLWKAPVLSVPTTTSPPPPPCSHSILELMTLVPANQRNWPALLLLPASICQTWSDPSLLSNQFHPPSPSTLPVLLEQQAEWELWEQKKKRENSLHACTGRNVNLNLQCRIKHRAEGWGSVFACQCCCVITVNNKQPGVCKAGEEVGGVGRTLGWVLPPPSPSPLKVGHPLLPKPLFFLHTLPLMQQTLTLVCLAASIVMSKRKVKLKELLARRQSWMESLR